MVVFQRETKLISCQRSLLSTTSSGRKEKNFISAFPSLCSLDFRKVSLSLSFRRISIDFHLLSLLLVISCPSVPFLFLSFDWNRQKAMKDTNSSRRGTDKDRKISNKMGWKTTSKKKKRENQRNKKEEIEQKHSRKKTKTLNQSDINYHEIFLIWCILWRRKSMNNNKFTRILLDIKSE